MAKIVFHQASKKRRKAKVALIGPAGSGKTKTALQIAEALLEPGQRIYLLDTEHESASLYSDQHDFQSCELDSFHPQNYIDAMAAAQQAGDCGALIIDSLSHAWSGKGGALELVDQATKRSKSGNQFTAGWGDVTPIQNEMVEALLKCKVHLIVTLRAKMAYVQEEYTKANGQRGTSIKKVGLEPIQRQGLDFEFDVTADMDRETNDLVIDKTRCNELKGKIFRHDGHAVGKILKTWLSTAADQTEPVKASPPVTQQAVTKAAESADKALQATGVDPALQKAPPDYEARASVCKSNIDAATTLEECTAAWMLAKGALTGSTLLGVVQQHYVARYKAVKAAMEPAAPAADESAA